MYVYLLYITNKVDYKFFIEENKDLKIGKDTSDATYQELGSSAAAKMENVYEPIKKVP